MYESSTDCPQIQLFNIKQIWENELLHFFISIVHLKVRLIMLTKLLISAIFCSSTMISQIEYVVEFLQSKQSQRLHKKSKIRDFALFLIRTCVCDKKDIFRFLNLQNYCGPNLYLEYSYILKNKVLYMLI